MRQLSTQFVLRSVIFPYNSLYTQAVAYTTYFELREPVVADERERVLKNWVVQYLQTPVNLNFH